MTHNLPIDGNGSTEGEIAIRLKRVFQSARSRRHQHDSFQQQGEISQAKHCLPFFCVLKGEVQDQSALLGVSWSIHFCSGDVVREFWSLVRGWLVRRGVVEND